MLVVYSVATVTNSKDAHLIQETISDGVIEIVVGAWNAESNDKYSYKFESSVPQSQMRIKLGVGFPV